MKKSRSKLPTLPLTPRQKDVLEAFRAYEMEYGCPATLRDIAGQLGKSNVTVFQHVQELVAKGYMRQPVHASGYITNGVRCPFCGSEHKGA